MVSQITHKQTPAPQRLAHTQSPGSGRLVVHEWINFAIFNRKIKAINWNADIFLFEIYMT